MYSPDLLQRVFYQRDNGDVANYNVLRNFLDSKSFENKFEFIHSGQVIEWTCFRSDVFRDIIDEDDVAYVYMWSEIIGLEAILRVRTQKQQIPTLVVDCVPDQLFELWILGDNFPNLVIKELRPIKYNIIKNNYPVPTSIKNLNYWLNDLLKDPKTERIVLREADDYGVQQREPS